MSANRWSDCPRCKTKAEEDRANAVKEAEAAYGKLPAKEYTALAAKADKPLPFERDSLREDWEIRLTPEGKIKIDYYCSCEDCGLKFSLKREADILTSEVQP